MFLRLYCTCDLEKTTLFLLRKLWTSRQRASVVTKTPDDAEDLCSFLWKHQGDALIPCGTAQDEYHDKQPFYLSTQDDIMVNGANACVFVNSFDHLSGGIIKDHMPSSFSSASSKMYIAILHEKDQKSLACFGKIFEDCQKRSLPVALWHHQNDKWIAPRHSLWTSS